MAWWPVCVLRWVLGCAQGWLSLGGWPLETPPWRMGLGARPLEKVKINSLKICKSLQAVQAFLCSASVNFLSWHNVSGIHTFTGYNTFAQTVTQLKHMKNVLTIIALLSSSILYAQRNRVTDYGRENLIRPGVTAGVNINKINGQSYKSGFNYNYQLGAFMQINFARRFGLQPEVNFVQASSEFTNDAGTVYDDLFRDGSQKKAKLSYLEVPVLLNINIGLTKKVKLQLGPSYGALLKQTVDSLKTGGGLYKNGNWSAIGGLLIQFPALNFGARYKLGLTDLNGIDNRQTWKSQSIQFFAGITF